MNQPVRRRYLSGNARRIIPLGKRCLSCQQRYRQAADGLCRTCSRDTRGTMERDAERLERQQAADQGLERRDETPAPIRELLVAGWVFDVMWDGSAP